MELRFYSIYQKDEGFRYFIILYFREQIFTHHNQVSHKEKNIFRKLLIVEGVLKTEANLRNEVRFYNSFIIKIL